MTVAARSRRIPRCDRCGLPGSLCLCADLPRVPTTTELVVLMHKTEIGKSSNTGRLALAVLERARRSIRGREGVAPEIPPAGRRLVLFPMPGARELTPSDAQAPLVLVVPDGSWSQARRMIDREPANEVLSDDQIVAELRKRDIVLARRTVAKYRESLGIASSVDRRRAKALGR